MDEDTCSGFDRFSDIDHDSDFNFQKSNLFFDLMVVINNFVLQSKMFSQN